MSKVINSFSPDIIHAHSVKAVILAGLIRRKNQRWKLIWHLHDYIPLGASRAVLIKISLHTADMVAAVSEDVARTVCGDKDVKIIPNSIELPDCSRERIGNSLRDSLGIPSDCHVIGYAGRLDPEKGIGILLESFGILLADLPGIRLLLAGDSPFRPREMLESWKNEASRLGILSQTFFLGRLESLDEFFRSIDLFVLPAPREPFGLVVLEALARGIPVVAFNSGGPREILFGLQGSLLVEPKNPEAIAEACSKLLLGKSSRAIAEKEGPALVTANYSPEVQVGKVCSMYAEILAS